MGLGLPYFAMNKLILNCWTHTTSNSAPPRVVVYPDGCRDLIVCRPASGPPQWIVTDLDATARTVRMTSESITSGFRVAPGATIDTAGLLRAVRSGTKRVDATADLLAEFCVASRNTTESLQALAKAGSVRSASAALGVSERTLQRTVKGATGKSPVFWQRLARVRQSACALVDSESHAQTAFERGYSDQSHMTREFVRWFGAPPSRIVVNHTAIRAIKSSGYG